MKLGVVGLPNVGKSTLFNAITKAGAGTLKIGTAYTTDTTLVGGTLQVATAETITKARVKASPTSGRSKDRPFRLWVG